MKAKPHDHLTTPSGGSIPFSIISTATLTPMTDIESRAAELISDSVGRLDRRLRPAFCKALMRLSGNALALATNHDEAAQAHIILGREHHQRVGGRR